MKLLDYRFLMVFALLFACDSGPPLAPLPNIASDSSCVALGIEQFSGGDLNQMVDRIFVGKVAKVSFVEAGLADNCDSRMYKWTLKVEFQVEENFKGDGDTAVVLVNPHKLLWNSHPLLKRDGIWLPSTGRSPALELSANVAWTGESAIQEGQTLLIHAREQDGSLFTSGMPWGYPDGEGFRFQDNEWCGFSLPQSLQHSFTLDALRTELQKAALVESRETVMLYGYDAESECRPSMSPPPFEEGPDLGNPD